MVVFPNAKINIGLDILRKRPDGYHDIATVMFPVDWCDILEIVPAAGADTTLSVSGRAVDCPPEKNLVMKAYRALDARVELPPVDIFLHKVIPDGAGLGGGSSDAAFTLTALNSLFSLGLEKDELAEIAAGIGADCPFFIYNRPMLATATGTDLAPFPLSLAGYTAAIVKPPVSVPTAAAYAAVSPCDSGTPLAEVLMAEPNPVRWQGLVKNDFERSVFLSRPEIAGIKAGLLDAGAVYAAMSGSGSAVFGIFAGAGDNLSETLRRAFPGCDIHLSPLA